MLLYKNVDHTFFSENQKELIRNLFGDYATATYKKKITELTDSKEKLENEKQEILKDTKILSEKAMNYIKLLGKVFEVCQKENTSTGKYILQTILPSEESMVNEKISIIESIASLDRLITPKDDPEGVLSLASQNKISAKSNEKP